MFPKKKIKNPPDFKYPHKFQVGDLIISKKNVNMGYLDKDSPAVIISLNKKDGAECVEIIFQNSGRVATYNIATLVMLFDKLT